MAIKYQEERKDDFISILSDGIMRQNVPEDTAGAEKREYETSKKDTEGNFIKGHKWEKKVESVAGLITDIKLVETGFGTLIQIELTDTFLNTTDILSLNAKSTFGEDFMYKLPNIDLTKEVSIRSYSYIPKGKTKTSRGLDIKQDNEKINNFFRDPKDWNTIINGLPTPTGDVKKYKTDDWKIYYLQVNKFLVEYTTEHFVSKFDKKMVEESLDSGDVDVEEIPGFEQE
jgi:hypothetical protein